MYRGYTQARNKASQKYNRAHLEPLTIRLRKGAREQVHRLAAAAGMSTAELFRVALIDYAHAHDLPAPDFAPDTDGGEGQNNN